MLRVATSIAALAMLVPGAAAARVPITADAAMRKGIRDFARLGAREATASRIHVICRAVPKVGDKGRCTGTFRLTRRGRSADYELTSTAWTLRISPAAIQYRVAAVTDGRVPGLPRTTGGFSGFLQGPSGR